MEYGDPPLWVAEKGRRCSIMLCLVLSGCSSNLHRNQPRNSVSVTFFSLAYPRDVPSPDPQPLLGWPWTAARRYQVRSQGTAVPLTVGRLQSPDSHIFLPECAKEISMPSRTHTAFLDNVGTFDSDIQHPTSKCPFFLTEDSFAGATVTHIRHLVWHPKWRKWEILLKSWC